MATVVVPYRNTSWDQVPDTIARLVGTIMDRREAGSEDADAALMAQTDPERLKDIVPQLKSRKMKQLALQTIWQSRPMDIYSMNDGQIQKIGSMARDAKIVDDLSQAQAIRLRDQLESQRQQAGFAQQERMQGLQAAQQERLHAMDIASRKEIAQINDKKNLIDLALQASGNDPAKALDILKQQNVETYAGKEQAKITITSQHPLTDFDETLAQEVASGKMAPSQLSKRTSNYNGILSRAKQINPELSLREEDLNFAAGKTASFRNKDITISSLPEVLTKVVEAGKKVDFSKIKAAGKVEQFFKGQLNDPDYVRYMTLRNDALLSIASVMRGTGATDQAHRVEMEAGSPTLSPEALDAWLGAQMESLAPRLKQYDKIYQRDKVAPSDKAPQSGPFTADHLKTMEPGTILPVGNKRFRRNESGGWDELP